MIESDLITGGCLCGSLRYLLAQAPTDVGDCHCEDCRRASGAVYLTFGSIERKHFRVQKGETRDVAFAGRVRTFAPCCGTALLFQSSATTQDIGVTIASLDHPENFPTTHAIYVSDGIPWVHLDPALPTYLLDKE